MDVLETAESTRPYTKAFRWKSRNQPRCFGSFPDRCATGVTRLFRSTGGSPVPDGVGPFGRSATLDRARGRSRFFSLFRPVRSSAEVRTRPSLVRTVSPFQSSVRPSSLLSGGIWRVHRVEEGPGSCLDYSRCEVGLEVRHGDQTEILLLLPIQRTLQRSLPPVYLLRLRPGTLEKTSLGRRRGRNVPVISQEYPTPEDVSYPLFSPP